VNKLPYMVRKEEEVIICAKNLKDDRIAPIFHVSNVTGVPLPGRPSSRPGRGRYEGFAFRCMFPRVSPPDVIPKVNMAMGG